MATRVPTSLIALVVVVLAFGGVCAKLYLDYSAATAGYEPLSRSYELLKRECEALMSSHRSLLSQYNSLQENYRDLEAMYSNVLVERDIILQRYQSLLANCSCAAGSTGGTVGTTGECDQLRQENSFLRSILADLEGRYKQLQSDYAALYERYSSLQASYASLDGMYRKLKSDYDSVLSEYMRVLSEHRGLQERYVALDAEYRSLLTKYNELLAAYSALESELQRLRSQQGGLPEFALRVNASLAALVNLLHSYCCIPHAFPRVLNYDEVVTVGRYLIMAGKNMNDVWETITNVMAWIRRNVKFVRDIVLMVPRAPVCDPVTRLCDYVDYHLIRNYVQEPSFTAYYGQGDCEDMAILAYAMLKHYFILDLRNDRELWIARIRTGDGGAHVAVFMPSPGGLLTIIDPAGAYLTATQEGKATARPALEELRSYDSWWSSYGGVVYIELYSVNVIRYTYTLVAEGDIWTVASYISSL